MSNDTSKTQIGIRLPVELVRLIDSRRYPKTRAEFCRRLIEAGLTTTDTQTNSIVEVLAQALQSLEAQATAIRQSAILINRDSVESRAEISRLRADLATAIVGVLTKLGQVVRDEDQRKFAREKAEAFVNRVMLSVPTQQDKEHD